MNFRFLMYKNQAILPSRDRKDIIILLTGLCIRYRGELINKSSHYQSFLHNDHHYDIIEYVSCVFVFCVFSFAAFSKKGLLHQAL